MKSRNEYIDIAKGIAIFLVVWGHVIKYTLPTGNDIYNLIYSFHMPVFFCISGYFANNTFLRESAIVFFLKKSYTILLPFIVWGTLYAYYSYLPATSLFLDKYNLGYWLLITLYTLYILFLIMKKIFIYFKLNNIIIKALLFGFFYILIYLIEINKIQVTETIKQLFSIHYICKYYPFFIAGYFINKYNAKINNIIKTNTTFSISTLLFIICFIIKEYYWESSILILICGMTGSYSCIYLVKSYYKQIPFRKSLLYMGSHSLNIYVIHYFFLNLDLTSINTVFFKNDANLTLCILLTLIIAVSIIILSLTINSILTISNIFNFILFGKRNSINS